MLNLGRPVSLNRKNVSEVCRNIYWKQGVNNISYNDVIKTSGLSKGSFYKLFNNEDDLQAETLKTYNKHVNSLYDKLEEVEDLFQMLSVLKNWKFNNNFKYCYFFVSYLEKYRMGKKTKNTLNKIEFKYRQLLNKVCKKHIIMNKKQIEFRDPVVERVVDKFVSRSDVGFAKYGVTLEDDKSNLFAWMNHLQEELMDAVLYMQKLKESTTEEMQEALLKNIEVHDEEII